MPLIPPSLVKKMSDKTSQPKERENMTTYLGDADAHGGRVTSKEQNEPEGDGHGAQQGKAGEEKTWSGPPRGAGIVPPHLSEQIGTDKDVNEGTKPHEKTWAGPPRGVGIVPLHLLEHIAASKDASPQQRESAAGTLKTMKEMGARGNGGQ
jgi:hypothetical protein